MKLQKTLFLIFVITLLALGTWLSLLFNIDPKITDNMTIIFFFLSLFIALSGLFTFIGFYLRIYFSNHEILFSALPAAVRQGLFLSMLITGLLVLKSLKVLNLWDGLVFAAIIVIPELFSRIRLIKKEVK